MTLDNLAALLETLVNSSPDHLAWILSGLMYAVVRIVQAQHAHDACMLWIKSFFSNKESNSYFNFSHLCSLCLFAVSKSLVECAIHTVRTHD